MQGLHKTLWNNPGQVYWDRFKVSFLTDRSESTMVWLIINGKILYMVLFISSQLTHERVSFSFSDISMVNCFKNLDSEIQLIQRFSKSKYSASLCSWLMIIKYVCEVLKNCIIYSSFEKGRMSKISTLSIINLFKFIWCKFTFCCLFVWLRLKIEFCKCIWNAT